MIIKAHVVVCLALIYSQIAVIAFQGIIAYGAYYYHSSNPEAARSLQNCINPSAEFWFNSDRNLMTKEPSTWEQFSYEILYMPANLTYYVALVMFIKNNIRSSKTWVTKCVGFFICILSFITTSRDFGLIIYRMFEYELNSWVHYPIFIYLFILLFLVNNILLIQIFAFFQSYKFFGLKTDETILSSIIGVYHIFQGLCVAGSFFIMPYFKFMIDNMYIVVLQNLFWAFLIAYSLRLRERYKSTRAGINFWTEWLFTLCLSLHLSFTVDYFYIFEGTQHSVLMKIVLCLVFLMIHIGLIQVYLIHQSYFCKPYIPPCGREGTQRILQLDYDCENNSINDPENLKCDYCMNNLLEPCLEYISITSKNAKTYKKLKLIPRVYIQTRCPSNLHLECFFRSYDSTYSCPVCMSSLNGELMKEDDYYELYC
ncbi:unnamed protein product [Moneuplotes crassus]|uniref:Uncharacterized protein n=1 Tax=Euplotes crassus TaxID=5936 RepID=A0AAD1UBL4_EUPCR|nr:unnamed protein product [Moneuplotes crassus]